MSQVIVRKHLSIVSRVDNSDALRSVVSALGLTDEMTESDIVKTLKAKEVSGEVTYDQIFSSNVEVQKMKALRQLIKEQAANCPALLHEAFDDIQDAFPGGCQGRVHVRVVTPGAFPESYKFSSATVGCLPGVQHVSYSLSVFSSLISIPCNISLPL